MAFSFSDEFGGISILCDNCFVETTSLTYIKCFECEIDLCLSCFVNQVEISLHSKYHKYRVVSKMDTQIHEERWTLMEEILFMEGLSVSGIGNWSGISKYIGKEKDVEKHFYKVFKFEKREDELPRVAERASNPYRGTIGSYMPYRRDFDVEYMNEYEGTIKDLSPDEGEIERRVVDAVLDSYMKVIKFRNRRKHAILEKNLVDMGALEKKDKDFKVVDGIGWIAPYLTRSDFNTFFRGIYIEEKLRELLSKCKQEGSSVPNFKDVLSSEYFVDEEERRLCKTHGIPLDTYIGIRKEMVSCLTGGKRCTKEDFNRLFGFLKETDSLYNFFLEHGFMEKKENK
ncbi:SANT domain-containing protein [Encephalitozoon hellem]|uniref:SANT domain-containing protein n=1 Tax=Encephalitozoon hellem TaxID=27973 RepID=A0ABY8CJN2_ENCHE|nr:SANT domain-containing protein [Encephalitozoon hellem]